MDRILTHPILGDTPEGRLVNFTYDGQTLQGIEGEPIAAALRVADVMVVNGKPDIRTCVTPLEEGMDVRTQYGASAEKDF